MSRAEVVVDPSGTMNETKKIANGIDLSILPSIDIIKRDDLLDDMEIIAKRAIGIHLTEMGVEFSQSALEAFFDLFRTHHDTLLRDLQRITQTQRRFKASPKDLKILLRDHYITMRELEDELIQSRNVSDELKAKKKQLEQQATTMMRSFSGQQQEIETQDPSFVFYSQHDDIVELVPPSHKRPKGIPSWLPQFPPDHTYLKSPQYLNRIRDQKAVRTKVAEESRLGEKALDHLISYEIKLEKTEIVKRTPGKKKVQAQQKELMEQKENNEYNIWTSKTEKKFDIVKYSKERLKFLERKRQKKEAKKQLIDHEYINMITKLSFYNDEADEGSNTAIMQPQKFIESQFQRAIGSFAGLKEQKQQREEQRKVLQAEEDKKREELKKQQSSKFDEFDAFENTDNTFNNFENFENFGDNDNTDNNDNNDQERSVFTFGGEVLDNEHGEIDEDMDSVIGNDIVAENDAVFELPSDKPTSELEPETESDVPRTTKESISQQPSLSSLSYTPSSVTAETPVVASETPSSAPLQTSDHVLTQPQTGLSSSQPPNPSGVAQTAMPPVVQDSDENDDLFDDVAV